MDAAAWPSSGAFILVKGRVEFRDLAPTKWVVRARLAPGTADWAPIACTSKKAYGCGNHGQELVSGITLHARLVDYPDDHRSALSITLSADAARSIEAEVDIPVSELVVKASAAMASRHLLVLLVNFSGLGHGNIAYYLVFDSTDGSLYTIPYLPAHLRALQL